jgi:predicted TIM-barrel fold metal-dependent hydrolase
LTEQAKTPPGEVGPRHRPGTDFPYENGDTFVRAIDYISDPQIDADAARAILEQNAGALLNIN